MNFIFSVFTLSFALTVSAWAKPVSSVRGIKARPQQSRGVTERLSTDLDFNFSGIASIPGCSGSIVTFGQPLTAKALLMTNGHCIGLMDDQADVVLSNVPYRSSAKIFLSLNQSISAQVTKVVYGIMQPHDVAFLELNLTYADLVAKGITSYRLSANQAPVGEPMIFASGLFREISSCKIVGVIYRLKEDKWLNENVIKFLDCDSKHGTSGTPLISAITREIIGINMTGNDSGGRCTMNNPCEIDENGVITVVPGAGYGDQIHKVLGCVNADQNFDLGVPGCALPKP